MQSYDPDIEELLGPPSESQPTRRVTKDLGPVHQLLLKACRPTRDGEISIPILARDLEMSAWGVYKWCHGSRIPGNKVARLVEIGEGRITMQDLIPYVIK